ncbi:hypothetical protein GBA52_025974 [Prunus armeniaca]|nr:hypothetical protein GBA52_025974 [Prunus armeniaca]
MVCAGGGVILKYVKTTLGNRYLGSSIFESKLCPKPLGRGHACLGVTRCCTPSTPSGLRGADDGLLCVSSRGWCKYQVLGDALHDNRWLQNLGCLSCAVVAHRGLEKNAWLHLDFQLDPRSSQITR